MRRLLYVPIIHMESDLGSAGAAVDSRSAALVGKEKWAKHRETVDKFWAHLAHYFDSLDAANLKIYQDGLPVDGELGSRIIEEAARRGSRNYQLVLNLMERGAEVIKTESPSLLMEEYKQVTQLADSKLAAEKIINSANYKLRRAALTKERDRFVARTINETLEAGEVGVLFMGSHHNVLRYLAQDIAVEHVKDRQKVNAYFRELTSGRDWTRFERMAEYLASPG